jgi:hypothetical protein
MTITITDLCIHRLGLPDDVDSIDGAQFAEAGLLILGGCEICHASIAAYNAYPSRTGYLRCADCIGGLGWDDVAQANRDIFEEVT